MRARPAPRLQAGHTYDLPGVGPCECILVTDTRARLRPLASIPVTIGDATFMRRLPPLDVSPTSILRDLSPAQTQTPPGAPGTAADTAAHPSDTAPADPQR